MLNQYRHIEFVKETILCDPDSTETTILPRHDNLTEEIINKSNVQYEVAYINNNTKILYLNDYDVHDLERIQQFKNIKCLYILRETEPSFNELIELNKCSYIMNILIILHNHLIDHFLPQINQFNTKIHVGVVHFEQVFIIPHHHDTTYCLYPLQTNETMLNFEEQYLPTKLIIEPTQTIYNDYRCFKYVENN
ncbi:hypothetical protein QTN25_004603 [Entamoeba marina]